MVGLSFYSDRFLELIGVVNTLIVTCGLLVFSASAVTSLAEERVRGSLDVLMTTPLTTPSIVWAKWWGAFRVVPLLATLPAINLAVVLTETQFHGVLPPIRTAWGFAPTRSTSWSLALLVVMLIVAYGAAITSLGLALATWISRPGRAAAWCASAIVAMAFVPLFAAVAFIGNDEHGVWLAVGSPFFGSAVLSDMAINTYNSNRRDMLFAPAMMWIVIYILIAMALLAATLGTFDRCLGRVRQRRLS